MLTQEVSEIDRLRYGLRSERWDTVLLAPLIDHNDKC
jgi:hypothetical protein